MATIVTRAGKGSPLTNNEVDANFTNLNSDKVETSAISAFGGTLIDDADAAEARTTLGLGTAATTASTDYATAAQGALADSALQSADNLSDLADAATARTNLGLGSAATSAATDFVAQTSATGSAEIPTGTDAQRDGAPSAGYFRFNTDSSSFEGYDGTAWGSIGGADFSSVAEDILPDADSTRDLGSSSKAWAWAYLDAIEPVGVDTTIKRVGGTNTTPIVEGIAKAWAAWTTVTATSLYDSLNVSSLTDNGVGDTTISFSNAFSAANNQSFSANCRVNQRVAHAISPATGSIRVTFNTLGAAPTAEDRDGDMTAHGDLA